MHIINTIVIGIRIPNNNIAIKKANIVLLSEILLYVIIVIANKQKMSVNEYIKLNMFLKLLFSFK